MSDSDNTIPFPGKRHPAIIKRQTAIIGIQKYCKLPKRKMVNNRLTQTHRNEVDYLVSEWVQISKMAKLKRHRYSYGQAYSYLFLYGLKGKINAMDQIEDAEFEECKTYLHQQISIARKRMPKGVVIDDPQWRNHIVGAIQKRCKELGVPDEIRKKYQLDRFGKESLSLSEDDKKTFTANELIQMHTYVMSKNPTFIFKPTAQKVQQDRENALRRWLDMLEKNDKANGLSFNLMNLPYPKRKIMAALQEIEPKLFDDMSNDQFGTFWRNQKICKLKSGKPLGSGKQ